MKKIVILSLYFLSFSLIPNEPNQEKAHSRLEQYLPTIVAPLWIGSVCIESLCALFPSISMSLYGKPSTATIQNIHKTYTVKSARDFWSMIAGPVFSNHTTLYYDSAVCHTIYPFFVTKNYNTIIDSPYYHKEDLQTIIASHPEIIKNFFSAELMIKHHYDAKILIASILVPIIVWTGTYGLDHIMKKINISENVTLKKASQGVEKLHQSFMMKTAVTASILALFIGYQRYFINSMTHQIINNILQ